MKKPKLKKRDPVYDWSEITEYIRKKYKRDVRDWAGKHSKKSLRASHKTEYQDFWHHLLDMHEISNGSTITIVPEEAMLDVDMPDWQKEIYKILIKEFGHEFDVLTSW